MPRKSSSKPTPKTPEAPAETALTASKVYEVLMEELDLTQDHRQNLISRGLSDSEIQELGYKTFPIKRRDLVSRVIERVGRDNMENLEVPGFFRTATGAFDLAGKTGIAIPVRGVTGEIESVKIRADKPSKPSAKYLLLSSNPAPDKVTGQVKYAFGASARTQVHYPLGKPDKIKVLRITEGELKADISFSLTNIYTISIPGVGMWRQAVEAIKVLKPEEVLLAFDSDKGRAHNAAYDGSIQDRVEERVVEDRYLVGKAVASLYLSLKNEAASLGVKSVGIEDWPSEAGKGIDDVLVVGATDQIRVLAGEEADKFAKEMLAEGMQDGWVYVVGIKRFIHTSSLIELDKEQYRDQFCHMEKGNPADNALRNPALTKLDFPIYLPNREPLIDQDNKRYFNMWRKAGPDPVPGDVTTFLEHVEYILPDPREKEILLDWLAYNIQNPGKKILWAILLQGTQGTGKSYFGNLMRLLLGNQNVSCPTNDVIHEQYTDWQKSCQLVVIEEIMAQGRLALMNKLKPIITQDITYVREMFKPPYQQPNVFNLLMFTNHKDAIIVDKEDRRYCVLFSPATAREHEYFVNLWNWTHANLPAILHFLNTRDLSNFLPLGHSPMTEGKRELIKETMLPLQSWIEEAIELEAWPFQGDVISPTHLLSCIPSSIKYVTPQIVIKALRGAGCEPLGQLRLKAGNIVRLWAVRRQAIWKDCKPEVIAEEYEKWGNNAEPGGNPMRESMPL